MEIFPEFNQIQTALASAQTIYIVLPKSIGLDKVAAALSLYLSLKKTNKQVSIYCSSSMTVEYSNLVGVDKIKEKLEGKLLTISFEIEESTQKVSYNVENNKLKIFVQPKEGFPPLDYQKVKYSYTGGQVDLIFIIGVLNLDDLGEIYKENKEFFETNKKRIFNLDLFQNAASFSEIIASLLSFLRLSTDADVGGNLYKGILQATKGFSLSNVGPLTFEAAAFCLRAGAGQPKEKVDLKPMPEDVSAQKPPEPEEKEEPSPDWYSPKIYKGGQLI